MRGKKGSIRQDWNAIRKQKAEKMRSFEELTKHAIELGDRLIAVQDRMVSEALEARGMIASHPASQEVADREVRPRVRNQLTSWLLRSLADTLPRLGELAEGIGEADALELIERPARRERAAKMSTGVLEERHIERYGERNCSSCGDRLKVFERIAWVVGQPEVWHIQCKPAEVDRRRVSTYTLTEQHVVKHGVSCCDVCGQLCEVGQRVVWKFGTKSISHEECGK